MLELSTAYDSWSRAHAVVPYECLAFERQKHVVNLRLEKKFATLSPLFEATYHKLSQLLLASVQFKLIHNKQLAALQDPTFVRKPLSQQDESDVKNDWEYVYNEYAFDFVLKTRELQSSIAYIAMKVANLTPKDVSVIAGTQSMRKQGITWATTRKNINEVKLEEIVDHICEIMKDDIYSVILNPVMKKVWVKYKAANDQNEEIQDLDFPDSPDRIRAVAMFWLKLPIVDNKDLLFYSLTFEDLQDTQKSTLDSVEQKANPQEKLAQGIQAMVTAMNKSGDAGLVLLKQLQLMTRALFMFLAEVLCPKLVADLKDPRNTDPVETLKQIKEYVLNSRHITEYKCKKDGVSRQSLQKCFDFFAVYVHQMHNVSIPAATTCGVDLGLLDWPLMIQHLHNARRGDQFLFTSPLTLVHMDKPGDFFIKCEYLKEMLFEYLKYCFDVTYYGTQVDSVKVTLPAHVMASIEELSQPEVVVTYADFMYRLMSMEDFTFYPWLSSKVYRKAKLITSLIKADEAACNWALDHFWMNVGVPQMPETRPTCDAVVVPLSEAIGFYMGCKKLLILDKNVHFKNDDHWVAVFVDPNCYGYNAACGDPSMLNYDTTHATVFNEFYAKLGMLECDTSCKASIWMHLCLATRRLGLHLLCFLSVAPPIIPKNTCGDYITEKLHTWDKCLFFMSIFVTVFCVV